MKVSPTSLCADDWQVLKYPRTTDWHEKGWRGLEPCSLPSYGSQPEGFGAEGTRSGLKIDRNCLPGSLLHWTTFEVNIKATFPAQAGFSFPTNYRRTKLDLRTTRSTFCSRGNSTQSLKGWRNMPGATLGCITAFILSCCHKTNMYNLIIQYSHISYCFGFECFVLLQGCSRRKFEWLCLATTRS